MSTLAEIAKDLTVAALHAQPAVVAPKGTISDEDQVAREVARLFTVILQTLQRSNVNPNQ